MRKKTGMALALALTMVTLAGLVWSAEPAKQAVEIVAGLNQSYEVPLEYNYVGTGVTGAKPAKPANTILTVRLKLDPDATKAGAIKSGVATHVVIEFSTLDGQFKEEIKTTLNQYSGSKTFDLNVIVNASDLKGKFDPATLDLKDVTIQILSQITDKRISGQMRIMGKRGQTRTAENLAWWSNRENIMVADVKEAFGLQNAKIVTWAISDYPVGRLATGVKGEINVGGETHQAVAYEGKLFDLNKGEKPPMWDGIPKRDWGPHGPPVCNSPDTGIATPTGEMRIDQLKVGDLVLSDGGEAYPIVQVSKVAVLNHRVCHVKLRDGTVLEISPGHPLTDGRTVGEVKAGQIIDGREVVSSTRIPYLHTHTFDILPGSPTGIYWANGVRVASTLESRAQN